jgi:hypothetical protein
VLPTCTASYLLVETFHLLLELGQLMLSLIGHTLVEHIELFLHVMNRIFHGFTFFRHEAQALRGKLLLAIQVVALVTKGSKSSLELVDNLFAAVVTHGRPVLSRAIDG